MKASLGISNPTPLWKSENQMPAEFKKDITKIEVEEQMVIARKYALEEAHRQLLQQKAAMEAVAFEDQQEKEMMRVIHDDIQALDLLRSKVPLGKNASTEIVLNSQTDTIFRNLVDRELEGLLILARRRQKTRGNYINLVSLLAFFVVYTSMLLTQRDQTAAFNVESRCMPRPVPNYLQKTYFLYWRVTKVEIHRLQVKVNWSSRIQFSCGRARRRRRSDPRSPPSPRDSVDREA